MKRDTIIAYTGTIFALVIAALFFFRWNPEVLLRKAQTPVTMDMIEQNTIKNFAGAVAGEDILRLSGAADFENMVFDADYATAEAVDVIPTGVYSLKPWAEPYTNRRVNGRIAKGKRKASVITSSFNMHDDYHQYYLLELADGTFIVAQIPQNDVFALERGNKVLLPIG